MLKIVKIINFNYFAVKIIVVIVIIIIITNRKSRVMRDVKTIYDGDYVKTIYEGLC
jgi:hypothetical protein